MSIHIEAEKNDIQSVNNNDYVIYTNIWLTNECVENAKVNFAIQGPRLIKTKNSEDVWCQGYLSVASVSNGLLFNGSTTVTKNFGIGETIKIMSGDTIQINEHTVIEFKQIDTQETIEKSTANAFVIDEDAWK